MPKITRLWERKVSIAHTVNKTQDGIFEAIAPTVMYRTYCVLYSLSLVRIAVEEKYDNIVSYIERKRNRGYYGRVEYISTYAHIQYGQTATVWLFN